ncbi:MAG: hypothetical protein RSA24_06615, partial [Clostridia bacterium]
SGGIVIVTREIDLPTYNNPGNPNTIYKYFKNGFHKSSRITDTNGFPVKSVHYTNHGNSKLHPQVPHTHNWGWKNGQWTEESKWY